MEPLVRLCAETTRTRMLVTEGSRDIGKVVLPPAPMAHPRAAATLLEGLSLFLGKRLQVVLCVDERSDSSCGLGLIDGLGYGERGVFFEVGVAARVGRGVRRERGLRLSGVDFRDLRQLGWEWSR